MGKIKVLHIEITGGYGGIESFLYNVYSSIDRRQYQFDFVTQYNSVMRQKDIKCLGGSIFKISSYKNPIKYCCDILQILSNGYDIIHIHKNSAANILPIIVARNTVDIPIIVHSHNTAPTVGGISMVLHKINQK